MKSDSQLTLSRRSYLLNFTAESAVPILLPTEGELFWGHEENSACVFDEKPPSLPLAKFVTQNGTTAIVAQRHDAETNITVNGQPLDQERILVSGDLIAVGDETMVFHADPRIVSKRWPLDFAQLRDRLKQEIERAMRYERPLSLLLIEIDSLPESKKTLLFETVVSTIRFVDVIGWNNSNEFVVVFPETSDKAMVPARRLLKAIAPIAPGARAGLAKCPSDGSDADSLLTGARNAAENAPMGDVAILSEAASAIWVDGHEVIAVDPKMKQLFILVKNLAKSEIPILITGETGVGKEIVASAIHAWSHRHESNMVSINCAAMPESLLESELFGHERGAFTGSSSAKPGLLEAASGGTVFFDEVSESSPGTQAKLLRVIETQRSRRIGAVTEHKIDVRIIAATNRNLQDDIKAGRFRRDLYYRLSAAKIAIPPLRDRMLDLPVLASSFLNEACSKYGRGSMSISEETLRLLLMHDWPGNVRELKNLMEYLVAAIKEQVLMEDHLPDEICSNAAPWMRKSRGASSPPDKSAERESNVETRKPRHFRKLSEEIRDLEKRRIEEALAATDGVRVRAAELIGMPLRTLITKLKVHGLSNTPSRRRSTRSQD
ncbi:MAG: AAA domain-containing protein [Proteobacteria bacterium]|nr:AAA domain-containing protein [Pseudomonadota bacterium]